MTTWSARLTMIMSINSGSSNQIKRLISVMQINTHDGVADHGFSTSLLQGIMWPQKNKVFCDTYHPNAVIGKPAHGSRLLVLAGRGFRVILQWVMFFFLTHWLEVRCGPIDPSQSFEHNFVINNVDGSSGAKVCLRIGGIRTWASWIGAFTFLFSAS